PTGSGPRRASASSRSSLRGAGFLARQRLPAAGGETRAPAERVPENPWGWPEESDVPSATSEGWKTTEGPKWTYEDHPLGATLKVKFDAQQGTFARTAKVKNARPGTLTPELSRRRW